MNTALIKDIVTRAIAGEIRLRAYPDGLICPHIQDYNLLLTLDENVNVDIPIQKSCSWYISGNGSQLSEYWDIFRVNGKVLPFPFAGTDSGEFINSARPRPSVRKARLFYNTDLDTPLTSEFFDTVILNLNNCPAGTGGGGGAAQPDFFYSGLSVTYFGDPSTYTPVLTSNFSNNIASSTLTSVDTMEVLFTKPYSSLWGLNVSFGIFPNANRLLVDPCSPGYFILPIFGPGAIIEGFTLRFSRSIAAKLGVEFSVLGTGVNQICETYFDMLGGENSARIAAKYLISDFNAYSRSPDPAGKLVGSGSLFRIEHPAGTFTMQSRNAKTYAGTGGIVDTQSIVFNPIPQWNDTNTTYILGLSGPGVSTTIAGTFTPQSPVQAWFLGNEYTNINLSVFGTV